MGNCSSCFAIFSMFSSIATCLGFFFPYWITGRATYQFDSAPEKMPVSFGIFRRCGYLNHPNGDELQLHFELDCGKYTTFLDIPSVWWRLATLIVGFGMGLTVFASILSFLACWIDDIWTRIFTRGVGVLHLATGLSIILGLLLHPLGWDATEVREVCKTSDKYYLGSCRLHWCYFILIAAGTTELLLFITSLKMTPVTVMHALKEQYADYEYAPAQDV